MPEYPGGAGALIRDLGSRVRYPPEALRKGITGKVYVRFVVDETGQVRDVAIMQGMGHGLDAETVRAVGLLQRFQPGTQNGKPVKVYYNAPVTFSIQNARKLAPPDPNFVPDPGVEYLHPYHPAARPGVEPAAEDGFYHQPAPPSGRRGVAEISFRVDAQGQVSEVTRAGLYDPVADTLAVGLVRRSTGWQPGRQGGVTLPSRPTHYVVFGFERDPTVFYHPDQDAAYTGGWAAFREDVRNRLRHPADQRPANGNTTTVLLRLLIDTAGRVAATDVLSAPNPAFDAEAQRAVATLSGFQPGRHQGQPVRQYLIASVYFYAPR